MSRTLEIRIEPVPALEAPAVEVVTLTRDVRRCYGTWASGGTCRIRVFETEGRPPVIVCTQIESTPGAGIHAFAEFLAASLVGEYFPHRFDEPIPAIWIEHLPGHDDRRGRESLDIARVTFATWKPAVLFGPTCWQTKIGRPTRVPTTSSELVTLIGDLAAIEE